MEIVGTPGIVVRIVSVVNWLQVPSEADAMHAVEKELWVEAAPVMVWVEVRVTTPPVVLRNVE